MKKIISLFVWVAMAASVGSPYVALAVSGTDGGIGAQNPVAPSFQLIPCNGTTVPCDFNMLVITFNRLLKFLLYLAIPLVLGMILYTGWLYLTANGESGQIEKAKKMIVPVFLGLFWIGASYIVIYTVIDNFVTNPAFLNSSKDAIKLLDSNKKP